MRQASYWIVVPAALLLVSTAGAQGAKPLKKCPVDGVVSGTVCMDKYEASVRRAFDMVGNLYEWVADWVPGSTTCGVWSADVSPTGDFQCLAGAATTGEPGALLRGGGFINGSDAGPLGVNGLNDPSFASFVVGFRCTR
jgi:formylglycine-generating enzyme required for sulfatase activity